MFPSNIDKHSRDDELMVRLCNYTDVYYNERITGDMQFMEATASVEQIAKFTLRAGDTIITKDSETADDIAISAYVPDDLPGVVCGYHLSMVRPQSGTAGGFVKRLFDSAYAKARFAIAANGLTRVGLGQYALENVELPFPPHDEQTAIAAFLDSETAKIDALIAEQEKLIALLAEKRQATISHAVTRGLNPDAPMKDSGVAWLGEVPAHWVLLSLKRICDVRDGTHDTPEFVEPSFNTYPLVTTKDISDGLISLDDAKHISTVDYGEIAKRSIVQRGDIIMPMIGSIGGAVLVNTDSEFAIKNIALFKVNNAFVGGWLQHVLNSKVAHLQFDLQRSGGVQSFVGLGALRNLLIPTPELTEQQLIMAFVDEEIGKLDQLVSECLRTAALLNERRSALIAAAVTGQIGVRTAA
ncbi:restriction endonuclease subunit S [Amantichitinum ursilacus]|uniref:restriction endonuclease subunit S n=1 Tax=Amantichitinum ursilacus TaxID=857265 RepID=UPI00137913B5|nr:restriction endonuclease subunit S [Amantichitinum ursilacus]